MKKTIYCIILFTVIAKVSIGQAAFLPYDYDLNTQMGKQLYSVGQRNHTSIKPYLLQDSSISTAFDSITSLTYKPYRKNLLVRKLFNEHLVQVSKKDYQLYLDFLPDFQIGRDISNHQTTWLNTRGIQFGGRIGKMVSFHTNYYEVQGKFPNYLTNYINTNRIVPGQGYIKPFKTNAFDYPNADGYISFTPDKHFTFQLGHGKTFIGDGYRSLLLSDNAFNYPFFKFVTTFGNIRLTNMWAQFSDFHNSPFTDTSAFPKKNGVFQYLDWSVSKRFTIGLFENIMWQPRGFDLNYLNPIIFLRPIEFSEGSPDKVLIGINTSYKLAKSYLLYGQLAVNEFHVKELFKNNGYWANKYGIQLGIRAFDLFKINGLNTLIEYNSARPFMYSANQPIKNYAHYNQSLAHPLGSNFRELLTISNYNFKRFALRVQFNYALYGLDDPTNPNGNVGKDLYKPYTSRNGDYGYSIGNGIKTNLYYSDVKISYLLNPKINLRFELGLVNRVEKNSLTNNKTNYITFGLRSSFRNFYYDF
ncbi:MAG TPA: hypothetical protein VET23_11685 [Chitinophagaceae bacterium]|nr:hypothetical protein [Chitinophagaceae bacterium]